MKPLKALSPDIASKIDYVLCDLDDTLTLNGRLPAASYAAVRSENAASVEKGDPLVLQGHDRTIWNSQS